MFPTNIPGGGGGLQILNAKFHRVTSIFRGLDGKRTDVLNNG